MPDALRKKSGHRWQKVIHRIRARDCGLCQECKRQGRLRLGAEVDHIVPICKGGGDEDSNLQLLCKQCHDAKTAADTGKRAKVAIGLDGWPIEATRGGGSNL